MTSFSSWGPADDGRIKPDICGNGQGLTSAYWHSSYPSETYWYADLNGTSMAAPNVTGSLTLLQEHYYNLNASYMRSATLKALVIQTADECGPDIGPDYMFGWGLLNAKSAANVISNRNISTLIKEEVYNGSSYTITVTANGTEALRATLVWTDPAGTPPPYLGEPTPILVNDLDMQISDGSTDYYPYKLDKDNPSSAASTGDNDVDNVEQIHIAAPTNSVYTISINHEGSISGGSQNFSLIVSGIDVQEPAVVTHEPEDVTATSVSFYGEAVSENGFSIIERGFVYGENENPTIDVDSKVILGDGLGAFNTAVSGLSANTTYHVRAYATNAEGTGYGVDKDFLTTSTTVWDGSSWDGGAPTADIHALIDGDFTSSGNLDCYNLTINSDKTFNISVNDGVTVNGDFTNNGTLNIKSSAEGIGSFINFGDVTNNGIFNMERWLSEDAWHFISSPLAGNTSMVFLGCYMREWDEITAEWLEINETDVELEKGIGYNLWTASKKNLFTFTGTPYSGNISIPMTKTENGSDHVGANLLANPFPSSIDWDMLDGEGYGAKYTYDGDNAIYKTYNEGGSADRLVPPGQGFVIFADYDGHFNVGNAERSHQGTENFDKNEVSNGLVLATTFENVTDELWIEFVDDATKGYERKYDAYKLMTPRLDLPQLYSISDGQQLSIDRRPETNTIQLGFHCQTGGRYNINIAQVNGIAQLEIEDTKTSNLHNLLEEPFEFEWALGDAEERFILHLSATGLPENPSSSVSVYQRDNAIYISQNEEFVYTNLRISNISGQLIMESTLQKQNLNKVKINLPSGVYLVQLLGNGVQKTEKIMIHSLR